MRITGPRTGDSREGQNKTQYQASHTNKIMAPQTLDQSEGDKVCGPDQTDKIEHDKGIVGLMEKISNQKPLLKLILK